MNKTVQVFELHSTNIDVNDGVFVNTLFSTLDLAITAAKQELEGHKQTKNIVEDFEGVLEEYDGKRLEYTQSRKCPAIYYRSHYGNYRCAVFIRTRTVL